MENLDGHLSKEAREDLMYGSTLAGMTIAQTGTTLVHSMGYELTYYKGYSHGRANGMLLPGYMKLISETMPDKVEKIWDILNLSGLDDFQLSSDIPCQIGLFYQKKKFNTTLVLLCLQAGKHRLLMR